MTNVGCYYIISSLATIMLIVGLNEFERSVIYEKTFDSHTLRGDDDCGADRMRLPDLSVDETLDGFTAATGRNPMDEVTTRVS